MAGVRKPTAGNRGRKQVAPAIDLPLALYAFNNWIRPRKSRLPIGTPL
jgi:hypothetical protein